MIWAGNTWVPEGVCRVCYQPECDRSQAGERPEPGCLPSRLGPRQREYRGYQEWAVTPEEARFLLHRGYAIVDGQRMPVRFVHNEAFVTQLQIEGTDPGYTLEERWYAPDAGELANVG